ncbi:MAG TPA: VWA domain-containing protein [Pyrinomonadaceae bacterium]|jgi:VWFA-related protein
MLYYRPERFLSPLLILILLGSLLCAPTGAAFASAQSRSGRKRTQARQRTTPSAPRAKPRRSQQRRADAAANTTAARPPDQSEGSEVVAGTTVDDGVRADLPLEGRLRVENRRGSVSVEVWSEQHVLVTARIAGKAPTRSPVVIQRTESLLSIGLVRAASRAASARVDLMLRVPERARAEIITADAEVTVRGLPTALSVQTTAGDISLEAPPDADITAETRTGSIDSTLPTVGPTGSSERDFHASLGAGSKTAELRSRDGSITLSPSTTTARAERTGGSLSGGSAPPRRSTDTSAARDETGEIDGRRPPSLGDANTGTAGAGTPASPSTGPQEVDEGDIVRVDTELVTLNVSVVNRGSNRGVADLTQKDFKLYEDGAEQEISHFDSASAPFNLVLLIDLSGSTKQVVSIIRNAALRFVAAARPADRIAVVTFANTPLVVSRLTSDRGALRDRINSIVEPQGSTKVYDSIAFTMEDVLKDAGQSRRNAIVLMSDGLDSTLPNVTGDGSSLDYRELLGRVQEFDGVFYSLWLDTEYEALSDLDVQPETVDLAHDRMKELSEAGGGMFYEVEKLEDLAGAYERVVADLGTLYSLGYRPTNNVRDGKWRAIRIAVAREGAVARGKRGYYAN